MNRSYGVAVIVVAACTGSPDGTTISGTNAFSATSTVMLTKPLHCPTSGVLASGKVDAMAIVVADVDLSAKCPSGPFDTLPNVLQLEIATGGYFAADPNAANQPIVAGTTFPILNENVADENLCGNVPSGTTQPTAIAILNRCPNGSPCTVYDFASAGSITVSSLSSTSVAGSFDLTLVNSDGESQGTLSGSFSANTCP
jgi:hypothetical protein